MKGQLDAEGSMGEGKRRWWGRRVRDEGGERAREEDRLETIMTLGLCLAFKVLVRGAWPEEVARWRTKMELPLLQLLHALHSFTGKTISLIDKRKTLRLL